MGACKIAIATNSLGKSAAGHDIFTKLTAAKRHGFDGVEIPIECLEAHAQTLAHTTREGRLRAAAQDVFAKASALGLSVIALNPFMYYDALIDPADVDSRLQEAELWCQLCQEMQCPIFQIPACIYPLPEERTTSEFPRIVENIRRLGLMAQKYNLTVAYEAPAWAMYTNTWQQIHQVIAAVGLSNVRHCLDTFHISAREAGDPFNHSAPVRPDGLQRLSKSLDELRHTIQAQDIAYFQLSDAIVADPQQRGYPLPDEGQPPFMTQSRNCRIFPCEPPEYGGTLPAFEVARTVLNDIGYSGWVSMEAFHTELWHKSETIPDVWAARGMVSWRNVLRRCSLEDAGGRN